MLQISQSGPVTIYRMGPSLGHHVIYQVHAFGLGGALVDCGARCVARPFLAALKERPPDTVLITHVHEDHVGAAGALGRQGAQVLAHPLGLPDLADPRRLEQKLYSRLVWRRPAPWQGQALGQQVEAGGHTFQVIPTAGHCPDHVCLYEPTRRYLFTGDLFCGPRVKYYTRREDFGQILAALRGLMALKVETIFCALLGEVPNGGQALAAKVEAMERLREQVALLHGAGASDTEIRDRLLGKEDSMAFITHGDFTKLNLIRSLLKSL